MSTGVDKPQPPERDLLYGSIFDGQAHGVFPRAQAERLRSVLTAIEDAETWGELREALDEADWDHIVSFFGDGPDDESHDIEPNDSLLASYSQIAHWLPSDLVSRYGTWLESMVSSALVLDWEAAAEELAEDYDGEEEDEPDAWSLEEEFLAELRARGVTVTHDSNLDELFSHD